MAAEKFALSLFLLLADVLGLLLVAKIDNKGATIDDASLSSLDKSISRGCSTRTSGSFVLLADAKGVAGLGKAGGDGSAGSDKAGQQVPPEVYNALTYAGTAFLFTLSVPLILYGLNKFLNWIEDCFGCGPSSKREKKKNKAPAAERLKLDGATNKLPQQQQTRLPPPVLKHQSQSLTSVNNGNISIISIKPQQQQQLPLTATLDSTTITLPHSNDSTEEAHYKAASNLLLTQLEQPQFIF